jgi:alanyl-tRNA synthetase
VTRKLFYEDPYLRAFTAQIVEQGEESGVPYVILDQTAFYPTGGGQPCDLGTIGGVPVVEVEKVGEKVVHRLARPLQGLALGQTVQGEIDWERRFDHMQQHTGQHILSAAFVQLYEGETVGFHMGRETVTIDITLPDLTEEIVRRVETMANQVVFDNRPIYARFVSTDELAALSLRKPPRVKENIRIVTIADYDHNPCGGTHPARTGEVGPIKILDWERYKGNVRVTFVCGWRALKALDEKQHILRSMSHQLTCGEAELAEKIRRLLEERRELDKALQEARQKRLEEEADKYLAQAVSCHGVHLVARVLENRPMQEMQRLAQRIAAEDPLAVILFVTEGDKTQLVFARGAGIDPEGRGEREPLDMNVFLQEVLSWIGGKGGGNARIAQGGGVADLPAEELLTRAVKELEARLESNPMHLFPDI